MNDPDQIWGQLEREFRDHGFLAPSAFRLQDHFRHSFRDWLKLSRDFNHLGQRLYGGGAELLRGRSTLDPVAMGLQLVPRGLGAFQGAVVLVEYGMAIEAKTLIRGTFETAFWIGYLHEDPEQAVPQLRHDTIKGEMGLYRAIIEHVSLPSGEMDLAKNRLLEMEILKSQLPRAPTIEVVATSGGFSSEFLHYKDLSGGAAHVSLKSAIGYLRSEEDGTPAGHQIGPDEEGSREALYLACRGLMTIIEATRRLINSPDYDDEFQVLLARFDELAPYNQANP